MARSAPKQGTNGKAPVLGRRLGVAIQHLRLVQGITQKALADEVSTTQASISQIENGRRESRVNLELLERISNALGKNHLSELIREAEMLEEPRTIEQERKAFIKRLKKKYGPID